MIERRPRTRMSVAKRRTQIIEAASQLISERGYWGFSLQETADRCGLSVPGLLHHVGSKENLLVSVLESNELQATSDLFDMIGLTDVPSEEYPLVGRLGLRQVCSALMQRDSRQPELVRLYAVLQSESLNPEHPAHDYFADRQRRGLKAYAALAENRVAQPRELAVRVMALMDGLQMLWLRDPAGIDLVETWEASSALLFLGIEE